MACCDRCVASSHASIGIITSGLKSVVAGVATLLRTPLEVCKLVAAAAVLPLLTLLPLPLLPLLPLLLVLHVLAVDLDPTNNLLLFAPMSSLWCSGC